MDNKVQINHSTEIKDVLNKHLTECEDDLLIISAFVKLDTLIWIDKNLSKLKSKKLLVRFRKSDILFGASDFEIIDYCMKNGWEIRFDLRLHSKVYVFDKKKFMLGSANATGSGLSLINNSNIESVVSGFISLEEYKKINCIFLNGTFFTKELIKNMKNDLTKENKNVEVDAIGWSKSITSVLANPRDIVLLKEDLLTSKDPSVLTKHDMLILNIKFEEDHTPDLENIKIAFLHSKLYNWLKLKLIENSNVLYFGELSSLLHESIAITDEVYRKEIKVYIVNLINWLNYLEVSEISIDRPNYSQRIRINI